MMQKMNWENLRKMLCPYCESELAKDIEIRCTECFFHIEENRFKSIIQHRAFPDRQKINLRWQNLKDDRCPVDNYLLFHSEEDFNTLLCGNDRCVFKIKISTLLNILSDKTHAANVFYRKNDHRKQ